MRKKRIFFFFVDEISTICINNNDEEQNIASTVVTEEKKNNNESPSTINNIEPSSIKDLKTENPINMEINNQQPQQSTSHKYCSACDHEFSHRSAYLRHTRRMHPTESNNDTLLKVKIN
jgi:hypothetical protein